MAQAPDGTVRLDATAAARLADHARRLNLSADALAQNAVAEFLDRADQRAQFRRDTLDSWTSFEATGLHVTADEADAWLACLEAGEDTEPPIPHR
jgi:predicted transcriptional regulator